MKMFRSPNWQLIAVAVAVAVAVLSPPSRGNDAQRASDARPYGMPPATVFGTPPPGTNASNAVFNGPSAPILDGVTVQTFLFVSGLDPYLWDVDLGASIQHTYNGDLSIQLMSPAGTEITISTRNGGSNDNVFATTVWDDDASELTTDRNYADNVNSARLVPEGALAAFVGENPNGNWRISISDATAPNTGMLQAWSLRFTTLAPSPMNAPAQTFTNYVTIPIPDHGPALSLATSVSLPGTCICDVNVQTLIQHAYPGDLRFSLRSPLGTEVLLSSNNGQDAFYGFFGTVWDDDARIPVTDIVYPIVGTAATLVPEGALGAFHGENPNGTWTFTIQDTEEFDVGQLYGVTFAITTCAAPTPEAFCFGDGSGAQCPCHNNSPLGSERGCRNGLGRGAKLTGIGAQSVSADSVQLTTEDTPFLSYVLYWQSRYTPNAGLGSVFDDGLLCSQAPVMFLGSRFTDSSLKTQFPGSGTPLHVLGGVPASGGTRFIQAWYRDAGNVCGTHNNLTNGVKVNWVP